MNDNQTPLLALEHLAFSYKADAPVFTDASLSLHPGEIIGLWSEYGSGKTTLLRLVTGREVEASRTSGRSGAAWASCSRTPRTSSSSRRSSTT